MGSTNVNVKSLVIIAVHGATTPDPLMGPATEVELLSTQPQCDDTPACGECWWDVHATVRELWIDNSGGGATLPQEGTFNVQARPRSELKHKVQWSISTGGGRSLFFDLNGQRVAVAGDTIQTAVQAPITNGQNPIVGSQYPELPPKLTGASSLPQGIVSITSIEAWAYPTLGPIGGREGRYTTRVLVLAAGPTPQVFVPPGATDLQITGTDALVWQWRDRTPIGAGAVVGTVNAALGESATVPVPGNAKLIEPTALPAADALYSLSWILRF